MSAFELVTEGPPLPGPVMMGEIRDVRDDAAEKVDVIDAAYTGIATGLAAGSLEAARQLAPARDTRAGVSAIGTTPPRGGVAASTGASHGAALIGERPRPRLSASPAAAARFGVTASIASKVLFPVALGLSAVDIALGVRADGGRFGPNARAATGRAAGGLAGAMAGAAIGAAVGSVVPVFGTAVGAFAGAVIGGMAGSKVGEIAMRPMVVNVHAAREAAGDLRDAAGDVASDAVKGFKGLFD